MPHETPRDEDDRAAILAAANAAKAEGDAAMAEGDAEKAAAEGKGNAKKK
jgi:hypothetical protein